MAEPETLPKIPSRTLICALRVSPSFYNAVQQAIRLNGDPTVILWQGQAAMREGDGTANPSLFLQDRTAGHPGSPLTKAEKSAIRQKLRDPAYTLRIVNSFAGENAGTRALGGIFALMHADTAYRAKGGVSHITYDLLYDGDGRNDKIHEVEHQEGGVTEKISEDNAPTGLYAPHLYRRSGADGIAAFDPHSKKHVDNLRAAFGKAGVSVLTTLSQMADRIITRHRQAIRGGRFRLGAPDGWDKKDDPERNAAVGRVFTVAGLIWQRMPELQTAYRTPRAFADAVMFGIVKVREAAYPGAPAKPRVTGLSGNVKDCACQLLDDLADSGGSLIQSASALLKAGAATVDAAICHGPAAEKSLHRILDEKTPSGAPAIRHLDVTNTMPRVEDFISNLDAEKQKRVTLTNSADAYIAHLRSPAKPAISPP